MITRNDKKNISVMALMSEAWDIRLGLRMPMFLRLALCALILIPISGLDSYLMDNMSNNTLMNYSLVVIHLVLKILTLMITIRIATIPCTMLAVRQAIGLEISMQKTLEDCKKVQPALAELALKTAIYFTIVTTLCGAVISYQSFSMILLALLILIIFYVLSIIPLYIFAIPLIVTRRVDFKFALHSAYNKALVYWPQIIGMYAAYYFLIVVAVGFPSLIFFLLSKIALSGFLTFIFVIVLLIALPQIYMSFVALSFTMGAVLFRDIYGLQKINPKTMPTKATTDMTLATPAETTKPAAMPHDERPAT